MRIAVAMSGGVDSSVAAHLLQQQGHEVIGLFMRTGIGQPSAAEDARAVADLLGIPLHILDCAREFERIVDYFCDEYCRGRTPNPCVICNHALKFGLLLRYATDALHADRFATGHYARTDQSGSRYRLLRGMDPEKDQSYFLFALRQDQLARAAFPNGDKTKREVRAIARAADLPVKEKTESQEICFVPDGEYRDLVRARRPGAFHKGIVRDASGAPLGEHAGIPLFTIGQRRGLGIAVGEPRYVVRLEPDRNEVIVGPRSDLLGGRLVAAEVNWVSIPPPEAEIRVQVQIRYAHRAAPAIVRPLPHDHCAVAFDRPQPAITPGQGAVFYDGDILLGGGWIE